jgi:hypothetical protein
LIRGTTPTFTLTVNGDVDLTEAKAVYVTLKQMSKTLELTGASLEIAPTQVKCYLTQEQSLSLSEGPAKIQVNWTYVDDHNITQRDATKVKEIFIDEQLLKRVI